jgi:hypothetical protein
VARKRRRKRRRLKGLLLFILTPIVVWVFAFLIWLNWDGIMGLAGKHAAKAKAPVDAVKRTERANEKLFDEERKRLDEIVKKRQ